MRGSQRAAVHTGHCFLTVNDMGFGRHLCLSTLPGCLQNSVVKTI